MESLGLLCGHLLGDYILQNDWMAKWKVQPPVSQEDHIAMMSHYGDARHGAIDRMEAAYWWKANLACTVHCLLYTAAVAACSFWWLPWWSYLACFLAHWPIDRWRLARVWMERVSGQKAFATGPLAPWSVIIVDNVFHIVTLFVLGLCARYFA